MKKATWTWIFLLSLNLNAIIVNPPSGPYNVGDTLSFLPSGDLREWSIRTVQWTFGDGTVLTVRGADKWVTHTYWNAGTYTVNLHDFSAKALPDQNLPITITENRAIVASPENPAVGQPVTFNAIDFITPDDIYWDFGDGTVLSSGASTVVHAYNRIGTFTVKAYDFRGNMQRPPITLTLSVTEKRYIVASPANPASGQSVTFTAFNFITPNNIRWNFGDGTVTPNGTATVTHTFSKEGTFTVQAYDWNGEPTTQPIVLTLRVSGRFVSFQPSSPREDQIATFYANYFKSSSIDWNFGDGSIWAAGPGAVSHRFKSKGTYTVSARETNMPALTPATVRITILPENRSVIASTLDGKVKEPITFQAVNFRGPTVLWDFGDGTILSNQGLQVVHKYRNAGTYVIRARDENGKSSKVFQVTIKVIGISDLVNLLLAEISMDNGKYYKIVPKNSRNIKAILKMKMKGTGIVSGYWIVDDQPFEFFNETAYQGEVKAITTRDIPGLPVLQPGMHTVTAKLTAPADSVTFPYLRYFVLPYENVIQLASPQDAAVVKEKEIPEFSWNKAMGASRYQIAFSNTLIPILESSPNLRWQETSQPLTHSPDPETWSNLRRNQWVYWKVRALDSLKNVVAESPIQEIKLIVPEATITVTKIADLDGKEIGWVNQIARSKAEAILIHGSLEYQAAAEFLILRVFSDNELVDQLLFRDVKRGEKRFFETSVQNRNPTQQIVFQAVKSSSPSLVIGFQELTVEKGD